MSNRRNRTRNAFSLESLESRTVLAHVSTIGHALVQVHKVHVAAQVSKIAHKPVVNLQHVTVSTPKIDSSPDPSSGSGKVDSSPDATSPDEISPDPSGTR
jgi:hypothetical protein